MKPTRSDVAKLAGVSTATVSYVLNKTHKVKQETENKVLDAVKKLGYKPNMVARSMSTKKTMQLGIITESIANPFFGEIIHGFEEGANQEGYFVNICSGFKKLDGYLDNFISRSLDGVFVSALPYKFNIEKLDELINYGIKVVVSGNVQIDNNKISSIENDHIDAMFKAVTYLYELGHRDIAYLSGLGRNIKYDLRIEGYLKAIQHYKLKCGEDLLFDGQYPFPTDIDFGYSLAHKVIKSGQFFTAVICLNDLMAMGASKAFKEHGYRIPEDVSIIGFDDIIYAKYWEPALTTMFLDKQKFGKKAFEILHNNIVFNKTDKYLNKLELIKRKSTAKCKA